MCQVVAQLPHPRDETDHAIASQAESRPPSESRSGVVGADLAAEDLCAQSLGDLRIGEVRYHDGLACERSACVTVVQQREDSR